MKIIVGCEESQRVAIAFRNQGHEAYSCDIKPCSGGHPEWHIQDDVLKHLNDGWDMGIFHPDCTYIANSGVHWLHRRPERWPLMIEASVFFRNCLNAKIPLVGVENPIPHKYALAIIGQKYSQLIQPYWFGDPESKATCLWLRGLPLLMATRILPKPECGHWQNQTASGQNKLAPSDHRKADRARTYFGIAQAMAEQWGGYYANQKS